MIERHVKKIEIVQLRVAKLSFQFAFKLIAESIAELKTGDVLLERFTRMSQEFLLTATWKHPEPRAALIKLHSDQALILVIGIKQQRHSQRVQNLRSQRIDIVPGDVFEDGFKGVEIVV